MSLGAIVHARMSSSRFPGKVLHRVNGKPMLEYLLERLGKCECLDDTVLATSTDASDDPVEAFCEEYGAKCFRGELENVAGRVKAVLDKYQFDAFVRVNGDSPLLDQNTIEKAAGIFNGGGFEIVTNVLERTYPRGQSVEILSSDTFRRGYERMRESDEFEHVTLHFHQNKNLYSIHNFRLEPPKGKLQLSVDTREDMEIFESIVSLMEKPHWEYGLQEVLDLHGRVVRK
ncbi:MAG: NTP transferase domain-containing protein [bacterium]